MRLQPRCAAAASAAILAATLLSAGAASAQDEEQGKHQGQGYEQAGQQMEKLRGGGDFPTDKRAQLRIQRELEIGNLGPLPPIFIPATPRYLVTYMNSQARGSIRSATATSVTNQSNQPCRVSVSYFKGFSTNASPVCSTTFSISPDFTVDYCSRNLPGTITTCNSTCNPELTFDEGRAIVSATCKRIGVSSRVYYTQGENDERLLTATDSKIVNIDQPNIGD